MAIRAKQLKKEPLTQEALVSPPTSAIGTGTFYTKTASGIAEGFFIDDQGREIQITENGAIKGGGGGSGTISGGSNLGTGSGVFAQSSGADLQFKSIKAGSNTSVTATATEITIASAGSIASASNSSAGTGVGLPFKGAVGSDLVFKKIKAGSNVTVVDGTDDITIAATGGAGGEANTASNSSSATGEGNVFKTKSGVDLVFKKIKAGSNVTVTDGTDDITIAATGGGSGEANTASSLGTGTDGEALTSTKIGVDLPFKRIKAGTNVTVSSSANSVTINATGGSGEVNTASSLGTGSDGEALTSTKVGADLPFKRIKAGTNVSLTSSANSVTINATGGSGEVNTASNSSAGTGTGLIFKTKSGVDLVFKRLLAGTNVTLTNGTDDITINATGGGSGEAIVDRNWNALTTGYVWIRASGLSADINNISVSKTANSVIISGVAGTAKLISATVRFDASDISSSTATIQYPEPNGETSLTASSFPTVVRFSAAGAQATTAFSVANSSGTVTLSCASLTNAAINYIKVVF